VFLGLWRGVHPQRLPSCLQGCPLHRSIDSACVLEKMGNEKHAYFYKSWGKIRGRKIKLLKHVFALYSLPIILSKMFSLARLRFILHLKNASVDCALPTPFIFFKFFGVIILDCQLPKFTENTHKIAKKMRIKCPKNVCRGGVAERGRGGGRREIGGKSAMVVGGDRRPW